jgi:hypothetical protein
LAESPSRKNQDKLGCNLENKKRKRKEKKKDK